MNIGFDDYDKLRGRPIDTETTDDRSGRIPIQLDRKGDINISQLKGKRKYLWAFSTIMKILNKIIEKDINAIKKKFVGMSGNIKTSEVKKKSKNNQFFNR